MAVAVDNTPKNQASLNQNVNYDQNLNSDLSKNTDFSNKLSLKVDVECQGHIQSSAIDQLRPQIINAINSHIEQRGTLTVDDVVKKSTDSVKDLLVSKINKSNKNPGLKAKQIADQIAKHVREHLERQEQERMEAELADGVVGDGSTLLKAQQVATEIRDQNEQQPEEGLSLDKKSSSSSGQPKPPSIDLKDPKNLQEIQRQVQDILFTQVMMQNGQVAYQASKEGFEDLIEKIKELFGVDDFEAMAIILQFLLNTSPDVILAVQKSYLEAGYTASALGRNKFVEAMLDALENKSPGGEISIKNLSQLT